MILPTTTMSNTGEEASIEDAISLNVGWEYVWSNRTALIENALKRINQEAVWDDDDTEYEYDLDRARRRLRDMERWPQKTTLRVILR